MKYPALLSASLPWLISGVILTAALTVTAYSGNAREYSKPLTDANDAPVRVSKRALSPLERQQAAERFIEALNAARMALAANQPDAAHAQIDLVEIQAQKLMGASPSRISSSKMTFAEKNSARPAYYPLPPDGTARSVAVETGPIKVKNVKSGPFWADNKGAAVTDAELVTIVIALDKSPVMKRLQGARDAIRNGELEEAGSELAALNKEVITIDSKVRLPLEKARDNLALARDFIQAKNYAGARFALGHARDALDNMEDSPAYTEQKERILSMRTDLVLLQDKIARNDPTALEKAEQTIKGWWSELKGWSVPKARKN